jgi:hypothetical protein
MKCPRPSPGQAGARRSAVGYRRFALGESQTNGCVLRGRLNYDALLHHPHELAETGIQDPALAAL